MDTSTKKKNKPNGTRKRSRPNPARRKKIKARAAEQLAVHEEPGATELVAAQAGKEELQAAAKQAAAVLRGAEAKAKEITQVAIAAAEAKKRTAEEEKMEITQVAIAAAEAVKWAAVQEKKRVEADVVEAKDHAAEILRAAEAQAQAIKQTAHKQAEEDWAGVGDSTLRKVNDDAAARRSAAEAKAKEITREAMAEAAAIKLAAAEEKWRVLRAAEDEAKAIKQAAIAPAEAEKLAAVEAMKAVQPQVAGQEAAERRQSSGPKRKGSRKQAAQPQKKPAHVRAAAEPNTAGGACAAVAQNPTRQSRRTTRAARAAGRADASDADYAQAVKESEEMEKRVQAIRDRLHGKARAAGYSVIKVDDNGDCQFDAIRFLLEMKSKYTLNLSVGNVRSAVAEFLRTKAPWDWRRSFDEEYAKDWPSYCDQVETPKVYGDSVTLSAAASCYNCRIRVYTSYESGPPFYDIDPIGSTSSSNLHMLVLGHYNVGHGHYVALVSENDVDHFQSEQEEDDSERDFYPDARAHVIEELRKEFPKAFDKGKWEDEIRKVLAAAGGSKAYWEQHVRQTAIPGGGDPRSQQPSSGLASAATGRSSAGCGNEDVFDCFGSANVDDVDAVCQDAVDAGSAKSESKLEVPVLNNAPALATGTNSDGPFVVDQQLDVRSRKHEAQHVQHWDDRRSKPVIDLTHSSQPWAPSPPRRTTPVEVHQLRQYQMSKYLCRGFEYYSKHLKFHVNHVKTLAELGLHNCNFFVEVRFSQFSPSLISIGFLAASLLP